MVLKPALGKLKNKHRVPVSYKCFKNSFGKTLGNKYIRTMLKVLKTKNKNYIKHCSVY